jgi:hypothetical protein
MTRSERETQDMESYGNAHGLSFQFFRVSIVHLSLFEHMAHDPCRQKIPAISGNPITIIQPHGTSRKNIPEHTSLSTSRRFLSSPSSSFLIWSSYSTNDASHNVSSDSVTSTYVKFLTDVRATYPTQPIFVMVPFGWPQPDGTVSAVFRGVVDGIVER